MSDTTVNECPEDIRMSDTDANEPPEDIRMSDTDANEPPEKKVRKKIILVDDIKMHLLSTKDRLKKHYEVYTAQSAEKLFEALAKVKPDLILLDINMPEMDGLEIIVQLKDNARYAEIPVIFLTSECDKKKLIKGMVLGAADFVNKPFSDEALIECIENQLDPGRLETNKPIILAVDDNPSILQSINHMLHDQYKVYTIPKPERLKDILQKLTPDLFLLDCKMPIMSGFDLIPVIRGFEEHEKTPVIFLTSDGTVDNLNVAVNLGACDFMVKPIDETVLREKVAQHLTHYIMRRRIRAL